MRQFLVVLLTASLLCADDGDWLTYYEKSGHTKTPRHAETIDYCRRLAEASPWISLTSFGTSPQGRDLPLVIADKAGHFTPQSVRTSDNVVILIQAGIHSGEIDGKDAGLMLLRDIAITKKFEHLLDRVTILFMPIFNVDGHERFGPYNRINQNGPEEMGWRVTAQNLNLNRDYLKADAPEMQAWLELYQAWLPEFFVDCHVTDGADYQYALTYALDIFGNMAPGLTQWTRDVYLAEIERAMQEDGFPISQYVFFRRRHDPKSGLISWVAAPRFSNGYTAIQNRPGLLIETHMLKEYKTRVDATYAMLKHTLALLNRESSRLRKRITAADSIAATTAFRAQPYPLTFKMQRDSVMIEFLGVAYEEVESKLSGGPWFKYSDEPVTLRIPFFNKQAPEVTVRLPEAYIIPPEWTDVIARLSLHGVAFKRMTEAVTLQVSTYRFDNVTWQERPFEGRHPVSFNAKPVAVERTFPAGSALVDMNQRAARVVAHILEPEAPDSFVYWGFFDAIFEQKEYAESYVMEAMARDMLAKDEQLKKEFERKKADNPEFGQNPRAILNWFYQKTPYWDSSINLYPVGKIENRSVVDELAK